MKLNNLMMGMDVLEVIGTVDIDIESVAYDSRKVSKGSAFVCITGFKVDGHAFAEQAIQKGASALVVERLDDALLALQKNAGVTLLRVHDGRVALASLSNAFYASPSSRITVVGVTGTNGKTSIAQMLTTMLEGLTYPCAVLGTIENRIGNKVYEAVVTTPESLELNQLFHEMVQEKTAYCTMEVSSHALELNRVAGIAFDYGVFTNLTKDHLDFHATMDAYFKAKALLFERTVKGNVINVDDSYGRRLADQVQGRSVPVLTYGLDHKADITAEKITYTATGSQFKLVTPDWNIDVKLPIPGKIYIYNFLASVGVLYLENIAHDVIKRATEFISPIPGRLEPVESQTGIHVIVDFAHTPDSLENVLTVTRTFTTGRLITVFGCGGDRDKTKRPEMGKIATDKSDFTFITSDNPRTEDPDAIIEDILRGVDTSDDVYQVEADRRSAIKRAIEMAKPNDTVLIAGKGHETYQIIGTTKQHFDDREIAREYLEA